MNGGSLGTGNTITQPDVVPWRRGDGDAEHRSWRHWLLDSEKELDCVCGVQSFHAAGAHEDVLVC